MQCHSMGGLVGLSALAKAPELFCRAVASAPMLETYWGDPPGTPALVTRILSEVGCRLGYAKNMVPPPLGGSRGSMIEWSDPNEPIPDTVCLTKVRTWSAWSVWSAYSVWSAWSVWLIGHRVACLPPPLPS